MEFYTLAVYLDGKLITSGSININEEEMSIPER